MHAATDVVGTSGKLLARASAAVADASASLATLGACMALSQGEQLTGQRLSKAVWLLAMASGVLQRHKPGEQH